MSGAAERLVRIQRNLERIIDRYDDDPRYGGDWLGCVKNAEAHVSEALVSAPPGFCDDGFSEEPPYERE